MTKDKVRFPADDAADPSQDGTHAVRDHGIDNGAQAVGRSKFDLGVANGRLSSEDIPWGYGENRVTAMARDPDWLYVYWEITDHALDDARHRLACEGRDASCCLRVHDTTGCVFDGSNGVSHFDIAVDRATRDWLVHVGKPHSSCHVEVGIKSRQGDFQPVVRSGRCDFPRKRPTQDASVEWLTVQEIDPLADAPAAVTHYQSRYDGPVPEISKHAPAPARPEGQEQQPYRVMVDQRAERTETWRTTWSVPRTFSWSTQLTRGHEGAYQRTTVSWITGPWRSEWQGDHRAFTWLRPLHRLTWSQVSPADTWEMAPYPGDSAAPGRVVVRYVGESEMMNQTRGQQRIVFGPWEVTIHGASHDPTERRVLGHWLMHWVQPVATQRARWDVVAERLWFDGFTRGGVLPGASENLSWLERGASEQWALGGSEQVWFELAELAALGGSEQIAFGASEQMLAGASEMLAAWSLAWLGASEMSFQAASEWLARGASEQLALGASEQLALGASEQLALGASERWLVGASELWGLGASEQLGERAWVTLGELVGASEWLGASERIQSSHEHLGASEQVPGVTGPRAGMLSELPTSQAFLPDEIDWTALGASDQVATATYPDSLQHPKTSSETPSPIPPPDDDTSNNKGGG